MMRRFSAAVLLVGMLGIIGCAHSPPTRYVTLSAEVPVAPAAPAQVTPIQLTAVHIPAELDRPEVVTQASANQLTVHDTDRWGAPLAQMMRRILAQDLLARLPAGCLVLPDAPPPPHTRTLVVTILSVEADADGTLTMQVAWALLSGHASSAEQGRQQTLTARMAAKDAGAQAAAMSHILAQLADGIASAIVARQP